MSKNTSQRGLRAKRGTRHRENPEFAAFIRRILAAYARRIGAGDIEALPSMVLFVSDVDTALREAVHGLRAFGYTWTDIAARLGVSRPAVVMRYADPHDRESIDHRILDAGLAVGLPTLVAVFADHHPGDPRASTCPGCEYRYPDGVTDCPTNLTVRPMLYHRRHEDIAAVDRRLNTAQRIDLHNTPKVARANRAALRRSTRPASAGRDITPSLLDLLIGGEDR